MSRKPFIAGNWKMNKNPEEAKAFVEAVASKLPSSDLVEAGIAAPAVDLTAVLLLLLLKVQTLKLLHKTLTLKIQVLSLVKLAHKF